MVKNSSLLCLFLLLVWQSLFANAFVHPAHCMEPKEVGLSRRSLRAIDGGSVSPSSADDEPFESTSFSSSPVRADSSLTTTPIFSILTFVQYHAHTLASILQRYRTVAWTFLAVLTSSVVTTQLPLSPVFRSLRRNMLAGCLIFTVGDLSAQIWTSASSRSGSSSKESARFVLDQKRLAIAVTLGAVWAGLVNPAVYQWAEYLFPGHGSVRRVLIKMLISCSILSTGGNWAAMFLRRWLSGNSVAECVRTCNHDFKEVLLDDLKIWPLYDIACYSLIPPNVRPISNAIMSSLWSMYISIVSAKAATDNSSTVSIKPETAQGEVSSTPANATAEQIDGIVPPSPII